MTSTHLKKPGVQACKHRRAEIPETVPAAYQVRLSATSTKIVSEVLSAELFDD